MDFFTGELIWILAGFTLVAVLGAAIVQAGKVRHSRSKRGETDGIGEGTRQAVADSTAKGMRDGRL